MGRLTIYDIAQMAGVSVTTVSRVLNGSSSVREETEQRVRKVIQECGYIPRQQARNFSQTRPSAVGLFMDDVRHAYMSSLAYSIDRELSIWKVNTILCNIVDVEREFIDRVDHLIDERVSGIILMGSIFQNSICKVTIERRYSDFPFVAVNGNFALPNVREVLQDQTRGTRDAVQHLYKTGKTRIGWVFHFRSESDRKKHDGFLEGTRRCGISSKRTIEVQAKSLEAGRRSTEELLKKFPDTDAIVYSADILAVGGAHYLNSRGVAIPEQIALIGFNNSTLAQQCYPPLTSVDNNIARTGEEAARLMIQILNGQEVENVVIPCGLAIRESTERKKV